MFDIRPTKSTANWTFALIEAKNVCKFLRNNGMLEASKVMKGCASTDWGFSPMHLDGATVTRVA